MQNILQSLFNDNFSAYFNCQYYFTLTFGKIYLNRLAYSSTKQIYLYSFDFRFFFSTSLNKIRFIVIINLSFID